MSSESPNQFTLMIAFIDPELTSDERDYELTSLLEDLKVVVNK
jgi:hypothetical protein